MINFADTPELMDESLVLFCLGYSLQEPIRDLSQQGYSFFGH
jgi:hypothetical protein